MKASSLLPGITAQPNGAASIFRYEFLRRKNSGLIYNQPLLFGCGEVAKFCHVAALVRI